MRKLLVAIGGLFLCLSAVAQSGSGTITASGADCTTVTACAAAKLSISDPGSATIQVTGTWTATLQFEASSDGGTTWVSISGTPLGSSTAVTSATAVGTWRFNAASITDIRVRCSAFTSGTAVISFRSSKAVANAVGGGGAVYASGNGTVNVIPKGNGSGQLADSSVTDDATTLTTTDILAVPATSSSTVAGGLKGTGTSTGFNFQSSQLQMMVAGARQGGFLSGNFGLATAGLYSCSNTSNDFLGSSFDTFVRKVAAASVGIGGTNSASPIAQALTVGESPRGGTDSNVAGASGTLKPGTGTGLGAGAKLCIQRNLMGATGSTAQSTTDGLCVGESKTLSNTSATATSLVNISVPSNSSGGASGTINVSCNDGTNFDSETNTFFVSYVNKATVMTIGTAQLGTPSTANNSGSCTTAITVTAGTNSIDIKVTPVITTIVPTTTTGTILNLNSYATGNATFN